MGPAPQSNQNWLSLAATDKDGTARHSYQAMAETVGMPCALAVEMMLAGKIPPSGVIRSVHLRVCTTCMPCRAPRRAATATRHTPHATRHTRYIAPMGLVPLSPDMYAVLIFVFHCGRPVTKDIYEPLLDALAEQGIEMVESETKL